MLRLISVCIFLSKSKKMSRDPLRSVHVSFAVKCIFIVIVCSMQFFFFIAFFLRSYMCRLHGFNIITWEDHWREKATQIDICKIYGQTKWYNKLGREDVHCAMRIYIIVSMIVHRMSTRERIDDNRFENTAKKK